MYRLIFEHSIPDQPPLETSAPSLLIGAGPHATLRLAAHGIADRHAVIEQRPDGYYLCDLTNQGNVYVNDYPVRDYRLTSGDCLTIGGVRLRFELVRQPAPRDRPGDPLFVSVVIAVGLLLLGEAYFLTKIAFEPRDPTMAKSLKRTFRFGDGASSHGPGKPTELVAPLLNLAPTEPPPLVALQRRIKIQEITRSNAAGRVVLKLRLFAQVAERTLVPSNVCVSVEWHAAGKAPQIVVAPMPSTWENFASHTITVWYDAPPPTLQGYVVRTYYRGQLQDERRESVRENAL